MRLWKKLLLGFGVFVLAIVALFVIVVGPWPTINAPFENAGYYKKDVAAIDRSAAMCKITDRPGRLQAGWGVASITPEVGVPLAGYSARNSKPSTGVHDPLNVKALAFSDGDDVAVLVGADMLLVPPNIAEKVRTLVASQTPLTANSLFFTASHTHDGPGGLAPGLVAEFSFGKYNPKVPEMIANAFASAIVDAYHKLEPAKMAHVGINAEQYIHNRARKGPVDGELSCLVVETDSGKRCYLTSFSAHPTILDDDNMEFTAEYPGFLQSALEKATGGTAIYLGGAVGSMSPSTPNVPDRFERCRSFGETLASLVLENTQNLKFTTNADVCAIGVPIQLPPLQMRPLSSKWRVSPILLRLAGLRNAGWMQAVRVGDVFFINTPGDFSGEISKDWKAWAATRGYDLWASGFSGEYAGYISPDKYYNDVVDEKGSPEYETAVMSWLGPHMEAFFTRLMNRMVEDLSKPNVNQQQALTPAHVQPAS